MDTEWAVELEGAPLNDLWGALNDPDPDVDPELSYFIKVRMGALRGLQRAHLFEGAPTTPLPNQVRRRDGAAQLVRCRSKKGSAKVTPDDEISDGSGVGADRRSRARVWLIWS